MRAVFHAPQRRSWLPAGSIKAMDRVVQRLPPVWATDRGGIWFVTKMKSNTLYEVEEKRRALPERNILSDEIIRLTGQEAEKKCPHRLRRVVVWDEEKRESLVLLTNHLEFGATTIAAIYKDRWQIELFFDVTTQCTSSYVTEVSSRAVFRFPCSAIGLMCSVV